MGTRLFLLLLVLALLASRSHASGLPRTIVPHPKELTWKDSDPVEIHVNEAAIVLGRSASEQEQYAAELLRDSVSRRFGQDWPVSTEDTMPNTSRVLILMGQRTTNSALDACCKAIKSKLSTDWPGHDGYIIETIQESDRLVVIAGGSNDRAVIYAADTLFQLLESSDSRSTIKMHLASIHDWPTVPWRGRPQTNVENHFGQGVLDAYARSRINFTDLRNGIYAFPADYQFTESDRQKIGKVIQECHRRGLLVYGSVDVGIPRSLHEQALKRFAEFIEMGVDGLWLSFDDHGPGEAAETIVSRVLELGSQHNIKDHLIATTPPKGSYQRILRDDHGDRPGFNKAIASVPGMEKALWFFTCLPSEEAIQEAQSIGLKVRPAWWHNWPRANSGFTHSSTAPSIKGIPCYGEVFPLSAGWHQPSDSYLVANGHCIEAIMPWGGGGWDHYWVIPQIGWLGWSPETYDWREIQSRVFDIVFGPSKPGHVQEFNDCLITAERLCRFPLWGFKYKPQSPPRLKDIGDRPELNRLLDQMENLLIQIRASAEQGGLLDTDHLENRFLKPMQQVIQIGRSVSALSFPEHWYEPVQRQILQALYVEDHKSAQVLIDQAKPRILNEIDMISQSLDIHNATANYVQWWRQWAQMNVEDWDALIHQRREELLQFVWRYNYYQVLRKELLKGVHDFPDGWGVGGGKSGPIILGKFLPSNREYFNGTWYAGVFNDTENNTDLVAFLQSMDCANGEPGNYAELELTLPVGNSGRNLALMFFMNRDVKNKVGHYYSREMWAGHSFLEIILDNKVIWEEDIGLPRQGREWSLVSLPALPEKTEEVRIRLRIQDRKRAPGMRAFVLMSPVHLVEIPADTIDRY